MALPAFAAPPPSLAPPPRAARPSRRCDARSRATACARGAAGGAPPPQTGGARRRRHFLNLSNGLEAAGAVCGLAGLEAVRVTRLQSSQCEAQAFDAVLRSVGPELLFSLAAGYECVVYDLASRDAACGVPRALFLGLQFVRFALARLWFDDRAQAARVRGQNVAAFWADDVLPRRVQKSTRQMLRFYRPFAQRMAGGQVRLRGVYGPLAGADGDKDKQADIVAQVWAPRPDAPPDADEQEFREQLRRMGLCVYDPECSKEELVGRQRWITEMNMHRL